MRSFDAIVVGGGIVGAAVLSRLVSAGLGRCLLIEQHRVCSGATGHSGGIIRGFDLDPQVAAASRFGKDYYRHFTRHTGQPLHWHTLAFHHFMRQADLGRPGVATAAEAAGAAVMSPEGADRVKHLRPLGPHESVAIEHDAGCISPREAVTGWLHAAAAAGAEIFEGVALTGIAMANQAVSAVDTTAGRFFTPRVVLCAGGWTPTLLDTLGQADATPPRARPIQVNRFVLPGGGLPPVAFLDAATGLYGRCDGSSHLLCGLPVAGADESTAVPRSADAACADGALAALRQRFAFARDAEFAGGWRSFDAYPPVPDPLLPRKTAAAGCYLCKGMAGGGIKLAPWFAQALIDLLKE